MVLNPEERIFFQQQLLPKNYQLVTEGTIQEGDLRWNEWLDCWNTNDPTILPRHKLIVGDPVKNFYGVCRKINNPEP